MNELITPNYQRQISDVTRDIRAKTGEFLRAAIEIGRLLFEAKALVEPGGWSKYIEEELPFSHSWANNYMKLYTEFGSDQTSLFGDSQAYMNLRPSQALEIIRLPEGDREEFMQTHDVESMSARQLKAAIDELKETKADLQAVEADLEEARAEVESLKDAAEQKTARFEEARRADEIKMKNLQAKVEAAEQAKKDAEVAKQKAITSMEQTMDKLDRAKEAEAKAKAALKKAQENPNIPESVMEQLRAEAEASAAEAATEEIRKKLAIAENALQEAERARTDAEAKEKDARDKLAAAQSSAKIQNPDLMSINVLGKQILSTWNTIKGHRMKAVEADPANAAPIDSFLVKVLCTQIQSVDGIWEKLQKAMADG